MYIEAIKYLKLAQVIMLKIYNNLDHPDIVKAYHNLEKTKNFQMIESEIINAFKSLKKMRDENNDAIINISSQEINPKDIEFHCQSQFRSNFLDFEFIDEKCFFTLNKNCREILRNKLSIHDQSNDLTDVVQMGGAT